MNCSENAPFLENEHQLRGFFTEASQIFNVTCADSLWSDGSEGAHDLICRRQVSTIANKSQEVKEYKILEGKWETIHGERINCVGEQLNI